MKRNSILILATAVLSLSVVAADVVAQPQPQVQEEDPVAKEIEEAIEQLDLTDVWKDNQERDEAHAYLKGRVAQLDSYYQEKAREVHKGINNREWPIESVSQYNFLLNAVESLWSQQEEEVEEDF